ncbi:hypothetical protein [Modestobacter muralis]|uniref:hypothetical protein n=1 Tax=Modestobacter muralis TaxID=1608614 RepID=UPI001B8D01CC|nr:hypothetical protein [Modestobacter muralis]
MVDQGPVLVVVQLQDAGERREHLREVLVEGVRMHRWAERDGTYAELVARRSQALSTLRGR